jgi:pentatricopeptide repeat protein
MSTTLSLEGVSMTGANNVMDPIDDSDELTHLLFEAMLAVLVICCTLYLRRYLDKAQKKIKMKKIAEFAQDADVKVNNVRSVTCPVNAPKANLLEVPDDSRLMRDVSQRLRDNDMVGAVKTVEQCKAAGCKNEHVANAGLLICAQNGDVSAARELLASIQEESTPSLYSYNTLVKVYATKQDLQGAQAVLAEMIAAGVAPNSITYNTVANLAASSGNLRAVLNCVETMMSNGEKADRYTFGILLKAVKKNGSKTEAIKSIRFMEQCSIAPGSDPVLMCTFLEVCMMHKLHIQMREFLQSSSWTSVKLPAHAYNMIIQAWVKLDEIDGCLTMWHEMVVNRGLTPNRQTVCAMVDALVRHGCADTARDLIKKFENELGDWYQSLWWKCSELRIEASRSTSCSSEASLEGFSSSDASSSDQEPMSKQDSGTSEHQRSVQAKSHQWHHPRSGADASHNWRAS